MPEATPTWADFVAGFQLGIYRDPVVCAVFAGLMLGVLGVFVVLRRAVFVTAVVSQSAGLGVALAFLAESRFGWTPPPSLAGFVLSLSVVGVLALPLRRLRLPREGFLGLLFVVTSAFSIIVGDRIAADSHDIDSLLFGSAVLVRPEDVLAVAVAAAVAVGLVGIAYRGLVFAGFDPEGARVHGLPVRAIDAGFWAIVSLAVSAAARALGALPVFALAVLPALGALAATRRLGSAVVCAGALGALSGGLGYLAAYFAALPVGACEAATASGFLLLSFAAGALRG